MAERHCLGIFGEIPNLDFAYEEACVQQETRNVAVVAVTFLGCGEQAPKAIRGDVPVGSREKQKVIEVLPPGASPERKVTLERARQTWERGHLYQVTEMGRVWQRSHFSSNAFILRLNGVRGRFAEIPITATTGVPRWVKIQLNAGGAGFDAIRFSQHYGDPADLI